jgi:peptidoglycan hydrolase-like protein with peptidoglycan-binding domain
LIGKTKEEAIKEEKSFSKKKKKLIQTYLKSAGFYKSAIDGDFGKGTRSAINNWQKSIDKDGTGYLTKKQIKLLERYYGGYLGYNYPR